MSVNNGQGGNVAARDATRVQTLSPVAIYPSNENVKWQKGGYVVYGNMKSSKGSVGEGYRAKYVYGSYDASNPVHSLIQFAGMFGDWLSNKLYNQATIENNGYIFMDWNWVTPGDTIIDPITPGCTFSWPDSSGNTIFYQDTIFWIRR